MTICYYCSSTIWRERERELILWIKHTISYCRSAQREGLLSEAHSEEVDQADPFYAHCKLHSDKSLVRRRRRNFLAFQLRVQQRQKMLKQPNHLDTDEHRRIERKLGKHRHKYLAHKASRPPPWGKLYFPFNLMLVLDM